MGGEDAVLTPPVPLNRPPESTQTVQALQHQAGEGPPSASREVEIRSLKSEIDALRKQIAGQEPLFLFFLFSFLSQRI